jgi:hypothetical protein
MRSLVALLLALSASTSAFADQTQIFGLDRYGRAIYLPASVCAYPGQELRLVADRIDPYGRRGLLPAESFLWRLTRGNGRWDQWAPAQTPSYGPFRRAYDVRDAIYLSIPYDVGAPARLESQANGSYAGMVTVVDANLRYQYSCEWAHPDVYVGGSSYPPPPGPVPPPPPAPNPGPNPGDSPCFNRCNVGAICTDGCPTRGRCNYVNSSRPYWRVLSCY